LTKDLANIEACKVAIDYTKNEIKIKQRTLKQLKLHLKNLEKSK